MTTLVLTLSVSGLNAGKKENNSASGRPFSSSLVCGVCFFVFVLFKDHCKQQQADLDFDSSEELVI